jgi:hypothetical protein
MSNEITTSPRAIARAVLSWPFDPVSLARQTDRRAVVLALDNYRKAMVPMCKLTKAERQGDQQILAKLIRSIGLRIRPDFSEDQARMWIAAMVEALDDQPASIALAATRDAQRHPMQFPGEVLKIILEKAEPHRLAYNRAIRNLERLQAAIDHPPALEATPEAKAAAEQISEDELQDMLAPERQFGLAAGFLIERSDGRIRWATPEEQDAHRTAIEAKRHAARAKHTKGNF